MYTPIVNKFPEVRSSDRRTPQPTPIMIAATAPLLGVGPVAIQWGVALYAILFALLAMPLVRSWQRRRRQNRHNLREASQVQTTTSRRRLRFTLLGLVWFTAFVAVSAQFAVETRKWQKEQAKFDQLYRDLNEVGGFMTDRRPRKYKYKRRLEFWGQLLWDEKLVELLDRVREEYNVRTLVLAEQPIGDDAMESVARLEGLEYLELQGTDVGDEGVAHLTSLPLRILDISRTEITDGSVEHLIEMPRTLGILTIEETNLSEDAVERLRAARPRTSITWSPAKASPTTP